MCVNYKKLKPQDMKLSVCLMFGSCNFSYSILTAYSVRRDDLRRTKSHWNLSPRPRTHLISSVNIIPP